MYYLATWSDWSMVLNFSINSIKRNLIAYHALVCTCHWGSWMGLSTSIWVRWVSASIVFICHSSRMVWGKNKIVSKQLGIILAYKYSISPTSGAGFWKFNNLKSCCRQSSRNFVRFQRTVADFPDNLDKSRKVVQWEGNPAY